MFDVRRMAWVAPLGSGVASRAAVCVHCATQDHFVLYERVRGVPRLTLVSINQDSRDDAMPTTATPVPVALPSDVCDLVPGANQVLQFGGAPGRHYQPCTVALTVVRACVLHTATTGHCQHHGALRDHDVYGARGRVRLAHRVGRCGPRQGAGSGRSPAVQQSQLRPQPTDGGEQRRDACAGRCGAQPPCAARWQVRLPRVAERSAGRLTCI